MGFFEQEDVGDGDEFLSVQPWKNQFRPPSLLNSITSAAQSSLAYFSCHRLLMSQIANMFSCPTV